MNKVRHLAIGIRYLGKLSLINFLSVGIFISILLLHGGCKDDSSFLEKEDLRTKLVDGIESYQNIDEIKMFLKKQSYDWEIIENSKSNVSKFRPPFNVYSILVKDYLHLSVHGDLKLTFFNDRLMGTYFYPKQFNLYLEKLIQAENINFNPDDKANTPPYTHIWIATDINERKYVGWEDYRLRNEMDLWIKKYALIDVQQCYVNMAFTISSNRYIYMRYS